MIFLIITVILFNLITIFIPKRISGIEIVTTTLFAESLQVLVDTFLDLKYNLYGYFVKGVDWRTLIYIIGIFPAVNIIFLNFYPKNQTIKKIFYIIGWTIFAILFEIGFLWSGTFYYNGWKLWYSAFIYPFLFLSLVLFHKFTCYLIKKGK